MNRLDRLYKIHVLLRHARRPVSMSRLEEELESSRNTVTRDIAYLRDHFGAPIIYNREQNGHQYDPRAPVFELPGLWMNASELHALLACEQLLESVQPGLFSEKLGPLKQRIRKLLGDASQHNDTLADRVRVQHFQLRSVNERIFMPVADATLAGRQLRIRYRGRRKNDSSERQIDPQRLLHYRHNWYLIAWCHSAGALRQFSIDRIDQVSVLDRTGQAVPAAQLEAFAGASFGIFSGDPTDHAHLRFTEQAARWAAEESWHPDQLSEWREDGYHLHVPYSDPTELIMEVLRYGPDVEVLGPASLREQVGVRIRQMGDVY
jgi:predicted DNA-binding transcriptional regulator YafY